MRSKRRKTYTNSSIRQDDRFYQINNYLNHKSIDVSLDHADRENENGKKNMQKAKIQHSLAWWHCEQNIIFSVWRNCYSHWEISICKRIAIWLKRSEYLKKSTSTVRMRKRAPKLLHFQLYKLHCHKIGDRNSGKVLIVYATSTLQC